MSSNFFGEWYHHPLVVDRAGSSAEEHPRLVSSWKCVSEDPLRESTHRLEVPGGWLYRMRRYRRYNPYLTEQILDGRFTPEVEHESVVFVPAAPAEEP